MAEGKFYKYPLWLPKTHTDIPAFLFMNVALIVIFFFEITHILPTVDENSPVGFTFHVFVGIFLVLNIYGNYIQVIFVDTSTRGIFLPTMLKEGWR